jgi:hypothetical protein
LNKRGITEDLFELLFTLFIIVFVLLVSFLLRASHNQTIASASASYNSEIDSYYLVNNILRTPVEINGQKATVADFIILSVEENPNWFKDLFGTSFRRDLKNKVNELAKSVNLNADLSIIYEGKTQELYYSGQVDYTQIFSDTVLLPSVKGDFIELRITRYVST